MPGKIKAIIQENLSVNMQDNLTYIDDYFNGKQLPEETREFEQRIISDPAFAEEVAFYLSALQIAKDQSGEEKKARFKAIYDQRNSDKSETPERKVRLLRKLWPYIAAAAIVTGIIAGIYVFQPGISAQQMADKYIRNQLQTLPVTMGTTKDSLQKGLQLFNEGKQAEALTIFENTVKTDTSSFTAKKYAGIVSLHMQQYDKALEYFKQLENHTGLYANPGAFFQALTLLKRNLPDDEIKARQLLRQVVKNDLEGRETAEEWLKKL